MRVGDLSPVELKGRLRRGGVYLCTGPFTIRLQTNVPILDDPFRFLYRDYALDEEEDFADFHVRIGLSGGWRRWYQSQARFYLDGRMPFNPMPARLALPLLEWGLNWCVARHAHQYLIIHSAVLERGGQALVLTAPPGAGKSTLCAAMVCRGWRLLTDELALIRPEDGRLVPLPRPVSLKNESIEVIREFAPEAAIGPRCEDTHKGTVAHMRPPESSVSRAGHAAVPAWVVFVSFQAGTGLHLQPVPPARAFMRLADNAFNYSLLGVTGFETLSAFIDASRCFELRYGDLRQATKELEGWAGASLGSDRGE